MRSLPLGWKNASNITSKSYTCGHCGNNLVSNYGYQCSESNTGKSGWIYICHFCTSPTFFDVDESQIPGSAFGEVVKDVPDETLITLYEEARKTTAASAYTATVLCCRKLLMHIAVSKGAKTGESFVTYVQYLADKNYVPPDAKTWVDHIRTRSNEANHEIVIMKKVDAEELLSFIQMLLKVIYEFPAQVLRKTKPPATPTSAAAMMPKVPRT